MKIIKILLCFSLLVLSACYVEEVDPSKKVDRKAASDAHVKLGLGYLEIGEYGAAKEPLKKAVELNKKNPEAYEALAIMFQLEKEDELAEKNFKTALALDAKNSRILNRYGSFLFGNQRYKDAILQFKKAAEDPLYHERSDILENIALTSLELNDSSAAKNYFKRAINLNWRQGRSMLEMAKLAYAEADYKTAAQYYAQFAQLVNLDVYAQDAYTLLLGVQIANANNDRLQSANYGLQLRDLFPNSAEYKQYKEDF